MCVENLRTGIDFLRRSILGVICLGLFTKTECFPIYLLGNPINMCWNPQNRNWFSRDDLFEGWHAQVYSKNVTCFPIYLLGNPINVCWNPQNRTHFSKMINLRVHMPSFTLKMTNVSPCYLLGNPINVCWNPQNRDWFSETIYLKGHMPRFTLKVNVFLSISLETPSMCVETLRTGLDFLRQSLWGVTCKGVL